MKRKIHRFLTQFYGERLAFYLYTVVVVVVVCETLLIEGTPSWKLFSSHTISEVYFAEYSLGDPIGFRRCQYKYLNLRNYYSPPTGGWTIIM